MPQRGPGEGAAAGALATREAQAKAMESAEKLAGAQGGFLSLEDAALHRELLLAIDEDYYRQLALLRERNAQAEREKIYENVGAWADALGAMANPQIKAAKDMAAGAVLLLALTAAALGLFLLLVILQGDV